MAKKTVEEYLEELGYLDRYRELQEVANTNKEEAKKAKKSQPREKKPLTTEQYMAKLDAQLAKYKAQIEKKKAEAAAAEMNVGSIDEDELD